MNRSDQQLDQHIPVLLEEVIDALAIQPDGIYIDGTLGRAGHAQAIVERLGPKGRLLAIDKDQAALAAGQKCFGKDSRIVMEQGSFSQLREFAERYELVGKVNGILLDLGVSSPQLDDPSRGFSFLKDGPLDMRMDSSAGMSAATWINSAKEADIAQVLKEYGEERYARRITRAIVEERSVEPIETTGRLASIVAKANPAWEKGKNPATRAFQGIRIFLNHELDDVRSCLDQCLDVLAVGGRLAVISFHSLEDRIVKRFMRNEAKGGNFPAGLPITHAELKTRLQIIGRAVKPGIAEVERNPRSRSAVLRIGEKLL
jgi:16S rRNA (cytosine1402-N4)-methyltransferase